jgi:hypothetical protein
MKKSVYKNYKNRPNRLDKIINNLFVIILIVFGVLIGSTPMINYYMGPYHAETFYNKITTGSDFTFVGMTGCFNNSSRSAFNIGFIINVSFINTDEANVYISVFNLSSSGGFNIFNLPRNPFYPISTKIYQSNYQGIISSTPLLQILFINTPKKSTLIGNLSFNDTSFTKQPYPNFGMPNLNYIIINGYKTPFFYISYENFRVLGYIATLPGMVSLNKIMKFIYPVVNYSALNINMITIDFGSSNTAPPQNWEAFFMWGFGMGFPLDIILIAAGIILYIMRFRK